MVCTSDIHDHAASSSVIKTMSVISPLEHHHELADLKGLRGTLSSHCERPTGLCEIGEVEQCNGRDWFETGL